MELEGNCRTTAMGILPHRDPSEALRLALSVDIPFWPQLPKISLYEDMYVQASQRFPGLQLLVQERKLLMDLGKFYEDLEEYVARCEEPGYLSLSEDYSPVYHRFLGGDLSVYPAVRGQLIGPVSFGLKVTDRDKVPIIYHDEVRGVIYDFLARKVRRQVEELRERNPRAFVWLDEPGLEMLFMAFTGYTSERAREDYRSFLKELPRPRGIHLCGNPDWSFLLGLDIDILSADFLQWGYILTRYTAELKAFLERGGILAYGLVPTGTGEMAENAAEDLIGRLEDLWDYLEKAGIDRRLIVSRSWLAPARCCLVNEDGTETVEESFRVLKEVSERVREKHGLG